jgi:hypothetical protein
MCRPEGVGRRMLGRGCRSRGAASRRAADPQDDPWDQLPIVCKLPTWSLLRLADRSSPEGPIGLGGRATVPAKPAPRRSAQRGSSCVRLGALTHFPGRFWATVRAYRSSGWTTYRLPHQSDARATPGRFYGGLTWTLRTGKPEALRDRGGVWFACGAHQLHVGVTQDFSQTRAGSIPPTRGATNRVDRRKLTADSIRARTFELGR